MRWASDTCFFRCLPPSPRSTLCHVSRRIWAAKVPGGWIAAFWPAALSVGIWRWIRTADVAAHSCTTTTCTRVWRRFPGNVQEDGIKRQQPACVRGRRQDSQIDCATSSVFHCLPWIMLSCIRLCFFLLLEKTVILAAAGISRCKSCFAISKHRSNVLRLLWRDIMLHYWMDGCQWRGFVWLCRWHQTSPAHICATCYTCWGWLVLCTLHIALSVDDQSVL